MIIKCGEISDDNKPLVDLKSVLPLGSPGDQGKNEGNSLRNTIEDR